MLKYPGVKINQLKHLYINPLERCNLNCKICYTKKTKFVLSNQEILDFIDRYQKVQELESVTFCGGEVFLLKDFPTLVNKLTKKGIFVQIISNGTIDRLTEIKQSNMVNLIISIDGLEKYHDQNRGTGNFQKSISLLQKAKKLAFHFEVFSIVTKENLKQIDDFEQELENIFGKKIAVTYHPRKPMTYLQKHPISNIVGQVEGFNFLDKEEIEELMNKYPSFPPKDLGCFQISLMSDGQVYACCEGIKPIGNIKSDTQEIITSLKNRLAVWDDKYYGHKCAGCVEKNFVCGFSSKKT